MAESFGRIVAAIINAITKSLPALLVYFATRAKAKRDSLEAELSYMKSEVKIRDRQDAVDQKNQDKSDIDLIDEFLRVLDTHA